MPFPFRHHPVYGLPFDAPLANELEREYRQMPFGLRTTVMRKVVQRELLLRVCGQARLRVARVPRQARRMLWLYTWTTVGDSLLDLAVLQHLPAELQIDLFIAPTLAPLQAANRRWQRVHTRVEDCNGDYDFVLMQDLSTSSLKLKMRCARSVRFATVFEHLRGECFDRLGFAQRRFEQLFGIAADEPAPPRLHLAHAPRPAPDRMSIAVALGARDPRRAYRRWPQVLQIVLARWPAAWPAASFVLMGDASAQADLAGFTPEFLDRHCRVEVERLDLAGVAASIAACDAFVGVDGGLMHIAVALDKPGAAVFVEIDPRLRLHREARLRSLFTPRDIDAIVPDAIATALLAALANGRG